MVFVLFLVIGLIFVIDIIPQFYTWQSRIHIGRWQTKELWQKKVLQKSLKWLKHTPTIKLTDNNRFIIIDILKGNYKRKTIQHWQEAGLVLGLTQAYIVKKEDNIKKQITSYIKTKIADNGNWLEQPKEVDSVILAYAILNIPWVDHQKNKPAYDAIYQLVQKSIGENGTVYYRKTMKDYRYVDTIGFICPFLISFGIMFKNKDAVQLGIHQIAEFNKYGMYSDRSIPCHTYKISDKLPVGLFGWGRGLGWYAIGLIDTWNVLPKEHKDKELLTHYVICFAKMAMRFQNENGSWNWIVTSKDARIDSSTTATLAWFLLNAAEVKEINEACNIAYERALKYLMKVTRRNGTVDFSQGDTKGIGVYSQNFDILPFTQGFTLRTLALK